MRLGLGLSLASGNVHPPDLGVFSSTLKKATAAFALKNTNHISSIGSTLQKATASFAVAHPFDPSSLPLTLWLRDFVSSPWGGRASAGSSGSNNATEATHPPTVGTAVNGKNPAAFNGTDQQITPAGTIGTYISASAGSGWALVNLSTFGVPTSDFNNPPILTTTVAGYYAIEVKTGVGARLLVWDGAQKTAVRALATGSYALITWRHNGTLAQIGVNEAPGAAGGASSLACGNVVSVANNTRIGANYNGIFFLTGAIADLGVSNTALLDADFVNIKSYINARYALSL